MSVTLSNIIQIAMYLVTIGVFVEVTCNTDSKAARATIYKKIQ